MNRDEVSIFEKLKGQLDGLYEEISILARKSPNDAVNSFKLSFVNSMLNRLNTLLGDKYKPFVDFASFDTVQLPSNSDVVLILSQYIQCMDNLHADNVREFAYKGWRWITEDIDLDDEDYDFELAVETVAPKKLSTKK